MNQTHMIHAKQVFAALAIASIAVAALAFPELAFAQDATGATGRVTKFFENINGLLNVASIAIVTIAVIFAGYQIAFNHKRIGDVAPVLIGGFLIGAAAAGYWIWDEVPDRWVVIGALTIIGSGLFIVYREVGQALTARYLRVFTVIADAIVARRQGRETD